MNQDSYMDPIEGKTYISPSIKNKYGIEDSIRIVTRAIDSKETYEMVKIKDEIVLRETVGGKNIITAKVFEGSRNILVLNIQEYTAKTGNPHKLGFAFIGDEITKLLFHLLEMFKLCILAANDTSVYQMMILSISK